ncbi:glycosyltransferase [Enterocloster bolteae]|uniref:glycosyltransferase n=1 Tax=Enterocloster bolteae TaxID=208479 RepID=UPI003AF0F623
MKSVDVSFIVPVYNVEKYLADCLDSILNQDIDNFEVICIEDCSTDHSLEILNQYTKKDKRVFIIQNEINKGLSYNRNLGMKIAKGRYIYFIDSDDKLCNRTLSQLIELGDREHLDVVLFEADHESETNDLRRKYHVNFWERVNSYKGIYTGGEIFAKFVENGEMISAVWVQLWNRKFLLENNLHFIEGILYEDIPFTFMALLLCQRVCCIREKYYIYRHREQSIMNERKREWNIKCLFVGYYYMLVFWIMHEFKFTYKVNNSIESYMSRFLNRIQRDINNNNINVQYNELIDNFSIKHLYQIIFGNRLTGMLYDNIEENIVNDLRRYKDVIIYGAGLLAEDVYKVLTEKDIVITSFAVTDCKSNSKSINNVPVKNIKEMIPLKDDIVVIVAVGKKYSKEVSEYLKELHFPNVVLL